MMSAAYAPVSSFETSAHGFSQDDPERAQGFIAFVSLLSFSMQQKNNFCAIRFLKRILHTDTAGVAGYRNCGWAMDRSWAQADD